MPVQITNCLSIFFICLSSLISLNSNERQEASKTYGGGGDDELGLGWNQGRIYSGRVPGTRHLRWKLSPCPFYAQEQHFRGAFGP
ncbi:unnamed protein product [Cuscuta epithymum]|uniref:Uncharacterized protein n=1 Tax=Cuscuta epithymum TaxID=186058 RepID=A0AAV0E281_9ASTE|nr:unnamed protein product [Cuscuta epithymum]